MAVKLRKPILVVGLGLSALWGLGEMFSQWEVNLEELGLLSAIAFGGGLWFLKRKKVQLETSTEVTATIDRDYLEEAIAETKATIEYVKGELSPQEVDYLQAKLTQLPLSLTRKDLKVAITGESKVGKTTLKQLLESQDFSEGTTFIETSPLLKEVLTPQPKEDELVLAADVALVITTGDLTESVGKMLENWHQSGQRLLVIFNKQDQHPSEQREYIYLQLCQKVAGIIPANDVSRISASPQAIKVVQHQENGEVKQWLEQPQPQIQPLCDRLTAIITQERELLICANTWREVKKFKQEVKTLVNQTRCDRALPIIEQYQWIAAAAAFANPVAALDLLATAAVSGQMLSDLSGIYQQKFSLDYTQTAAAGIGKLMVKLGIVELSTQTVASFLKSNAFTYLAGGTVQGISAAYLTRIAGLSLIAYFQEQELNSTPQSSLNLSKLGAKLQQVLQENQRIAFIKTLIPQALKRLPTAEVS